MSGAGMMRTSLALTMTALGGCASARFEAALATCDPAVEARADPVDALGYAAAHEPPLGTLKDGAARNYEAAPPWVMGQPRVYPFDASFSYDTIVLDTGREDTPLLCRLTYDRNQRRGFFAADVLTNVELSAVYEVPGKSPQLRAHGPRDVPSMILLDSATDFVPGDELRLAVVDRDSRWGFDDALVDFTLEYGEAGVAAAGSGMMWRGSVAARCGHLDPQAVQQSFDGALTEIDTGLSTWRPQLEPEGWDFGLSTSGMTGLQALLERAASLRGWDAPEVRERGRRLLATQLCFERAAVPEVARRAAWVARRDPLGTRGLRIVGTGYACKNSDTGVPTCRLTGTVTNPDDESRPLGYATYVRLVLAGGREIPLTLERSTVNGQSYDGPQELPGGSTATVVYRLDIPLRDDRELARPVMLRDRRRQLFSDGNLVKDLPLRLAHGPA
jgi:hypothetical protein